MGIDDHIRRLQISMQNTPTMGVVNGPGDGLDVGGDALGGQHFLTDELRQSSALDEFHREEPVTFGDPGFVNADNVWVIKACGRRGFDMQNGLGSRAGEAPVEEHLHGTHAVEDGLARFEDHTGTAPPDFLNQLVRPKLHRQFYAEVCRSLFLGRIRHALNLADWRPDSSAGVNVTTGFPDLRSVFGFHRF
jgi:hypothetical protein